jgi:hypothetical protein
MARTDVNPTDRCRKFATRAAAKSVLDFLEREHLRLER